MEALLSQAVTKNATSETKKPEAKVTHVGLKDVTLEFVTYNAKIALANPYPTPIPIFQITYALKSADRELVSGNSSDPEPLKPYETTVLELEMKVSFTLLLSLARDIAADWDIDYDLGINLVGNIPPTGNITITISNKGQMKLPTLKDLSALAGLTTNLSVSVQVYNEKNGSVAT